MNRIIILLLLVVFSIEGFSQAYEGTIEYNKKKHDAFIIEYPFPPEAVEQALKEKMEGLGYRAETEKGLFNKDKGMILHRSAFITEIHESSMDYVFKIEPKNKKEKNASIVYFVVMKDGANAKPILSEVGADKAKAFLNNLNLNVENSNVDLMAKAQADGVGKAEKKYKTLQDKQAALEKKIQDLQLELENNLKEQELQLKEVENQKKLLDEIKGRKKTS